MKDYCFALLVMENIVQKQTKYEFLYSVMVCFMNYSAIRTLKDGFVIFEKKSNPFAFGSKGTYKNMDIS